MTKFYKEKLNKVIFYRLSVISIYEITFHLVCRGKMYFIKG